MAYVLPVLGEQDEWRNLETHNTFRELKQSRIGDYWHYEKVSILRNENDRMASVRSCREPITDEPDEFYYPASHWLCDDKGNIVADTLIRFEDLGNAAKQWVKDKTGYEGEFPHLNKDGPFPAKDLRKLR